VINTHSLHNAHLLRRALPRGLIAPVPFIDPEKREAEHARLVAEWRENPKSRTAQEQAREKKRAEETSKGKKGKQSAKGKRSGTKRSADGMIEGEHPLPKEDVKEEMVLVSELDTLPRFLVGIRDDTGDGQLGVW